MNENVELIKVLSDLYAFFNERFFNHKLPADTVITLQAEGRTRLGFYHPNRWIAVKAGKRAETKTRTGGPDEIAIHSELALGSTFEEIAAAVVHQMAHQAQEHFPAEYGEPSEAIDTSNHYHNKAWHWLMTERLGLRTEGPKGLVQVTPMFRAILREFPAPKSWMMRVPSAVKAPTKMKLWRCKCTRVRCATTLDATCNRCGQKFKLQRDIVKVEKVVASGSR